MKRTIMVTVLLTLLALMLCGSAIAEEVTIVDSGTCGENLTWELDSEGTLTIDGAGKMDDFGFDSFP